MAGSNEVYLVTGANRGIGLETCRQLKARGATVIAAVRAVSDGLTEVGVDKVIEGVDVSSDDVGSVLTAALGEQKLNVLINNAGVLHKEAIDSLDYGTIRQQFEINTLGPLKVTTALLPSLADGGKVVIVTSRMGSIDDNGSGGYYGYRASKAAVNMVGKSLAQDLKAQGFPVLLVHPGFVKTDMTDHADGAIEPSESVTGILARIDELTIDATGAFKHANGEDLPW